MVAKLKLRRTLWGEIAHHYESGNGDSILSRMNDFRVRCRKVDYQFSLPISPVWKVAGTSRLARRVLRLDKSTAAFNHRRDGVVVLYRGAIWLFDLNDQRLKQTGELRQCRNVLHGGFATTESGLFFGEYGKNSERATVPIWRSRDDGKSWEVVYEFAAGSVRHVHGVHWDEFDKRLWVATGDFDGECQILVSDPSFDDFEILGDGSQAWRAVSMFFTKDKVTWGMDSPLARCQIQEFDRATKTIRPLRSVPGPVWFSKALTDGVNILQTTVEIGDSIESENSHLYVSRDLLEWNEIESYQKDRWPMPYFKFGVVAFADGPQTSEDFVIFGEGLKGIDGKVLNMQILDE